MATFFRTLLPSGLAVKFKPLTTRDKFGIDRAVTAVKGDEFSMMLHTVAVLVVAVTKAPVSLVVKTEERTGADGKPLAVEAVDPDATLNAIPEDAWRPVQFDPLDPDAPGGINETFAQIRDFNSLMAAIEVSTYGGRDESFAGKVQQISGGP